MAYRLLTSDEIGQLISQNCFADNWSDIQVSEGFSASTIKNTRFEGEIKLGLFDSQVRVDDGLSKKCGIYDSYICNCDISDNVYISGIRDLTNYSIADHAILENVDLLVTDGETSFGNGTEIDVLNEAGGRRLPLFDRLSSQIAYMTVLYRHDKEFIKSLLGMINDYVRTKVSTRGRIESYACIRNSRIIRNVFIGSYSSISGATVLEEGSVIGCEQAPAFIGEGVVARKFIALSGSRIEGNALIEKTFVGQGSIIGKQFSAENSVFFANSEAFHGEGCSVFAGPYTVTHHKSTLLIACMFSFYNAGSGTNQSNHMYKLGPVHQGILERGSKTGSFAYLLLPCRIGAFSVVMGKHLANFDSSDFPFSYITEEKGKSELNPAMNIFTVGTRRDTEKWASRDRRTDPDKLDLIHFSLFNPYIVGRMLNGINILNDLAEKTPKTQDYVNFKGINIHRLLFKTSKKYYEMALKSYIGQEVVKRLQDIDENASPADISSRLNPNGREGTGKWVDICGMFCPGMKIDKLIATVKSGTISSINDLNRSLLEIYNNYDQYAWQWCAELIKDQTGFYPQDMPSDILVKIINDGKLNSVKFNNMILKDAEKEFDSSTRTGFGIDGEETERDMDFLSVRGEYMDNKFVQDLQKEISAIELKADRLISIIAKA